MLAYAANTPNAAARAGSPRTLALILLGHAAVISAVLMAKPEIIERVIPTRTILVDFKDPLPPEPEPQTPVERQQTQRTIQDQSIDHETPIIDMGRQTSFELDRGPIHDLPPFAGNDPIALDPPRHVPVKLGPRFATNENALKPPYPLDKIRAGEEATLQLRLTIDARGRVTSVEPVGAADPSFLEAARRHILRAWRYKPATQDGVAIPSSTVINLSFRLEDV